MKDIALSKADTTVIVHILRVMYCFNTVSKLTIVKAQEGVHYSEYLLLQVL